MKLKSSVLIVDPTYPSDNVYGADVETDLNPRATYSVIVVSLKHFSIDKTIHFFHQCSNQNPNTQFVLQTSSKQHPEELKKIMNEVGIFKFLSSNNEAFLERTLQEAIAEYDLKLQNQQLLSLFQDQNEQLKTLSLDLEERVLKRQKFLESSREKLLQANQFFKALLSALFAIQKSNSIPEIESNLHKALSITFNLSWLRITYQNQSQLSQIQNLHAQEFSLFSTDLKLDNRALGKVTFARSKSLPFSTDDTEFFTQVSQAVALALDRLTQLEKSEFLKQQWKSTFDAILEPVSLITSKYELRDFNSAFEKRAKTDKKGKLFCYSALFGRTEPCLGCQLGKSFGLGAQKTASGQESNFEVSSQRQSEDIFVNIYRDMSEQNRIERQILESSKMAELGTIGGSIAHELNNPLAGLITFVQLIKADLHGDEDYKRDIIEMERAALRCKEIIENLLSFTRKNRAAAKEKLSLNQVAESAIKIINLKASSLGIKIEKDFQPTNVFIEGLSNPLSQSLVNLLQNAIDSLTQKMKSEKFVPKIEVRVSSQTNFSHIDIIDNGLGLHADAQLKAFTPFFTTKDPEKHRGLGLAVAFQIIQDHGGSIDLSKTSDQKTRARITFPSSF